MIFNTKAAQKNAGQKLTDHYLLNELWSELDETSQASVSGGVKSLFAEIKRSDTMPNNSGGSFFNGSTLISFDDRGN